MKRADVTLGANGLPAVFVAGLPLQTDLPTDLVGGFYPAGLRWATTSIPAAPCYVLFILNQPIDRSTAFRFISCLTESDTVVQCLSAGDICFAATEK